MLTHPVTPSQALSANITSNHPVCRLYRDDRTVTEKIVNLSVMIVMVCYMVEMTPLHGALWAGDPWCCPGVENTSELSCH